MMLAFDPVCCLYKKNAIWKSAAVKPVRKWHSTSFLAHALLYCISQACACRDVLVPIVFLAIPGVCLSSACIYFHHVFVVSDAWQASLLFSGRHLHLSAISHTLLWPQNSLDAFALFLSFPTITLCRLTRKWLQNVIQLFALWRQNLIYPDKSVQCMKQRTVI